MCIFFGMMPYSKFIIPAEQTTIMKGLNYTNNQRLYISKKKLFTLFIKINYEIHTRVLINYKTIAIQTNIIFEK